MAVRAPPAADLVSRGILRLAPGDREAMPVLPRLRCSFHGWYARPLQYGRSTTPRSPGIGALSVYQISMRVRADESGEWPCSDRAAISTLMLRPAFRIEDGVGAKEPFEKGA